MKDSEFQFQFGYILEMYEVKNENSPTELNGWLFQTQLASPFVGIISLLI